tara:strand:+ start:148 stop:450 length:303 start_codon:yes stop_codon:yes gene_type:complete
MTRKDYQLIADVLRNSDLSHSTRSLLALNFAAALKQDNPRFKPVRFCMATMPSKADSEAIKANNADGFEAVTDLADGLAADGFKRIKPDGTIEYWRPIGK